jgi:PAS domain S-box-containing protein
MQGVMRPGSWVVAWRRRLLRVGAIATALLVAGLLAVGAWVLWTERESARAIAVSGTEDLLAALDGDIARTIETYDLSLQSVADSLRLPGVMALSPELRRALLLRRVATARYMGSMFVLDREGRTVIASEAPIGTSFADREDFLVQRSGPDAGLFVGRPIVSRISGLLSIPLSRRLVDEGGAFVGVVGGVVHMEYLRDLFGHLRLTDRSTLTLVRDDGTVMARAPWQPGDIGRNLRGSRLMKAAYDPAGTIYDGASPLDGVRRLHVFRRVDGLPLTLVAGISPAAVDAPWWGKVRVASVAALGLVLLGAGFGALLRRELRRRGRAERSQRRAQARFQALFEHAAEGLFLVRAGADGEFRYEAVNPALCRGFAFSPEQFLGQRAGFTLSPDQVATLRASYADCLRERRPVGFSMMVAGPAGPREWQGVIALVPELDGGDPLLVGSARDVTERNRAEAEQRQAQKMEAIGQLTAGIAHDFNNLLQVVLGGLEMLAERLGDDPEDVAQLCLAQGAARRGAALTARLLTAARCQSLDTRPVDLAPTLGEAAELLRRTLGPQVEVEAEVQPGTWRALADADQLQTALLNLAINARDAMPRGGKLRLVARNAHPGEAVSLQLAPGEHVVVRVEDEGTGMDAATLARACDPFFTTKSFGKGLGLGLAMVHGFARQSKGDLRITSVPGRGTVVELWLPGAVAPPTPVVRAEPASVPTLQGSGGHILLVEDEAPVRRMLTMFLERAGCTVSAVDSAAAALETLGAGLRPDLLVTDHAMPGLSGAELLRLAAIRLPGLPGLLVTGYDEVTEREALPPSAHVLLKPFQRGAFIAQVGALLAENAAVAPRGEMAEVV